MQNYRIPLNDIPAEGRQYTLDDPRIWENPLREFRMDCRIVEPLCGRIAVQRAGKGWLLRGSLTGAVVLPCSRCAEDARVPLAVHIEELLAVPQQGEEPEDGDRSHAEEELDADSYVILDAGVPLLDLANLCWQEFVLALPVTPLCREDCQGLCPRCGANRNNGPCGCAEDEGDPRLAALRGLVVRRS